MKHPKIEFMSRAIELAKANKERGGFAVGALVVDESGILAEGVTTLRSEADPTAHAEINAIRAACAKRNSRFLEGCYLYTTFEPCPMCTSAAVWARMKGIVFGASMTDASSSHPQRVQITAAEIIARGEPLLELHGEVLHQQCSALIAEN